MGPQSKSALIMGAVCCGEKKKPDEDGADAPLLFGDDVKDEGCVNAVAPNRLCEAEDEIEEEAGEGEDWKQMHWGCPGLLFIIMRMLLLAGSITITTLSAHARPFLRSFGLHRSHTGASWRRLFTSCSHS